MLNFTKGKNINILAIKIMICIFASDKETVKKGTNGSLLLLSTNYEYRKKHRTGKTNITI